jgi:hypothetical protein
MLCPGYRNGFLGGPGVADMEGTVGATRELEFAQTAVNH